MIESEVVYLFDKHGLRNQKIVWIRVDKWDTKNFTADEILKVKSYSCFFLSFFKWLREENTSYNRVWFTNIIVLFWLYCRLFGLKCLNKNLKNLDDNRMNKSSEKRQ